MVVPEIKFIAFNIIAGLPGVACVLYQNNTSNLQIHDELF